MKLTPVYHRDDHAYRVVYRPHNQWVAQHLTEGKSTREFDPWQDLGPTRPTRDEAIAIMHQRKPLLPTKAIQYLNQ